MSIKTPKSLTPKFVCKQLVEELHKSKISVKIQTAVTTSLYLRLDRGILGSCRIGDHGGRRHYQYTYEIGSHIREYTEVHQGEGELAYTQYCFPLSQWEDLATQIRIEKANKIARTSQEYYLSLVHNAL